MAVFFRVMLFLILMSAGTIQSAQASDPMTVFVSILPQKYFLQQIGKDRVDVRVMVQPGASPATYEPKPRQMAALSTAKAYFSVGVPFEKAWLHRISAANPTMLMVATDEGIKKRAMAAHHHDHDDGHGHESAPAQGALDPHIWLSPPLVKIQVATMAGALGSIDPVNKAFYQANAEDFSERIDALHNEIQALFTNHQGLKFMVFHPSWGYFARAYGLRQIPMELEGKAPKPAQLQKLIALARHEEIGVVFVQPQFSARSAQLLAREINGRVAVADPLAENWVQNLKRVAIQFTGHDGLEKRP